MPIANIQLIAGREPHLKTSLIKAVTTAIAETLDVKPETIRVILSEVPAEHWGIGGVTAKELGR